MLALNPRGRLPIVTWGDVVLYESMAICQFLELEKPEPAFIPKGAPERARTLRLAYEAECMDKETEEAVLFALGFKKSEDLESRNVAYRRLHTEVARWEAHLQQGGSFLVGDSLTLADIAVFPGAAFLVRTGLTLSKRAPKLAAWYERLATRPSVQASWPPHWRESQGSNAGYDDIE
jgi:glutathione S-transferase